MDSSNSQQSHPRSGSGSGQGSDSGSDSCSRSGSDGSSEETPTSAEGNSSSAEKTSPSAAETPSSAKENPSSAEGTSPSAGETSSSAKNSTELPPESSDSSRIMQTESPTGDQPEEEEDMDVEMANSTLQSPKYPLATGKGKEVVDDTTSSSSRREGKADEIGLLADLYNLHNKTGRYHFPGSSKRDFYKFWIEEEREYANKVELDKNIKDLHSRFLKNADKNVECPTDPIDIEIFRLSHWIWGTEIDSDDDQDEDSKDSHEGTGGDQDQDSKYLHKVTGDNQDQDSKDLNKRTGDDEDQNSKDDIAHGDPNDPSQQEPGDDHHGVDHMDTDNSP